MNDRRKKPRMMDEAEEIITLGLLMNGKVWSFFVYIYFHSTGVKIWEHPP